MSNNFFKESLMLLLKTIHHIQYSGSLYIKSEFTYFPFNLSLPTLLLED